MKINNIMYTFTVINMDCNAVISLVFEREY
jgi:hypothetical protein